MEKRFDYQNKEKEIYNLWEKEGYFSPEKCMEKGVTSSDAEPFSMVLPPPNVTGVLHMGHAAMLAIQDVLARYNRMQGKRTLWIPGTDHAAIATQSKVEKEIYKKEKKNRHDLGREELLKRIEEFAQESHDTIESQIKAMGASLDWSREAFTLDEKRSYAVNYAFKKMYDDDLIYRGNRIINWDPKGQTTVSDDEVDHIESTGKIYTFKYSKDFPISIATTRPETKFGDTAVAVNPEDKRYKDYINKEFEVDFLGHKLNIKVVGDEEINSEFGTGAVGVTPAHSFTDADIAERHNLKTIQVINEYAKMSLPNHEVDGLKTKEAREWIVKNLESEGLLEKEESITQNISKAERTGGVIEPLPKLQWFIDVNKEFEIGDNK
ncbi:MAG: class I tRNA ligase family protein, partial [Candidatus Paceibacterota bacterium]